MATIGHTSIKLHNTRAAADALAKANAEMDDAAEYRVIENAAGKFVVQVFEDGEFLGTL